jgi:putrescine transport system ATP-binding protein
MSDNGYLTITDVSKAFGGVKAVDGVTLNIRQGEFFSLLGPSGCGKTTLMRMIAGFEQPDQGSIVIDGEEMAALPPYERPVNMMFQSYALFPHLSVAGNIAFGLKQQKRSAADIRARTDAMLAMVQLDGLADRKPHQLSGGQKQRVALARALARGPKVLLLDEPLGALDKKLRKETQIELKRIQAESGTTFVVVTHDQDEAMALSNRIAIMRAGRMIQIGAPMDIYRDPADAFVAGFIGDVNVLPVMRAEQMQDRVSVETPWLAAPLQFAGLVPSASKLVLGIRPESITLSHKTDPSRDHWLPVTIRTITPLGPRFLMTADVEGQGAAIEIATSAIPNGLQPGSRAFAGFSASDVRLLPA